MIPSPPARRSLVPAWVLSRLPRRTRRRLSQLESDVAILTSAFRGQRPAPLLRTGFVTRAVDAPRDLTGREVEISEVIRETADAVTLRLRPTDDRPLEHLAGEFLTLLVDVDGQTLRRAYSLCTPPGDPRRPAVTVKRVAGGRASNHLVDNAAAGLRLRVLGPSGAFIVRPDREAARHYVLVAGGSGITPLRAILETVLRDEPRSRVTLVYGNRAPDDVIFADALAALATTHPTRLAMRHVLETPPDDAASDVIAGRLDADALAASLDATGWADDDDARYLLCGPEPMMEAAHGWLVASGVPAARIRQERFASPAQRQVRATTPQPVTLLSGGRRHVLQVPPDRTVLEVAVAAGLAMPFSCTLGGCGACRVRVVDGALAMDEPSCLSAAERADGWALTCVGHPLGPVTLEIPS